MKKMKRVVATLLAAGMALTLSFSAIAATATVTPTSPVSASSETTVDFVKKYVTTNNSVPATFPKETLTFNVEPEAAYLGNGEIRPNDLPTGATTAFRVTDKVVSGNEMTVGMTIPAYDKVGRYNYTVTEVAGSTQGVNYDVTNNSFNVQVLVTYNETTRALEKSVAFTKKNGDVKVDSIVNKYDLGAFDITKTVSGNMGNKDGYFTINVTLTSDKVVLSDITYKDFEKKTENGVETYEEVTKTLEAYDEGSTSDNKKWVKQNDNTYKAELSVLLTHNGNSLFSNLPAGVYYTVEEDSKHTALSTDYTSEAGYTATYTGNYNNVQVTADSKNSITVNNARGTSVDTGVILDSAPYVLLLALAGLGTFAVVSKKREEEF